LTTLVYIKSNFSCLYFNQILFYSKREEKLLTLYGIKNCDTVKKAIKWLDANNKKYVFFDYKQKNISKSKLEKFVSKIEKNRLINKKSLTWRNLQSDIKSRIINIEVTDNELIEVLSDHPLLIKRPIIESEDLLLIGFSEQEYNSNIK
tara:strand:+ start:120 stop:563 length:444 start_codon:yes stop_codon:yes gene_type:complete